MSLTAAAAALNAPEEIVQRSAEARSKATGTSVDEILAAWAGGSTAPVSASSPAPAAASPPDPTMAVPSPDPAAGASASPAATSPVASPAPMAPSVVRPAGPIAPPVLVGSSENPMRVMVGAGAIFLLMLTIGLFTPASPEPGNGVRTSAFAYSAAAEAGRDVYLAENCAACHTQQIRPVAADAGQVERVTLSDSNQVLGSNRLGPDLANLWARTDPGSVSSLLVESNGHPSYASLDQDQLANLVAYLTESG